MEAVRSYIFSVTGAALLCAVATAMIGKKGTYGKILKVMSSAFMTLVLVCPLVKHSIRFPDIYMQNISTEADQIAQQAGEAVNQQIQTIIKEKTEAYILDKATDLNANLTVSVILSEDGAYPVPQSVQMSGSVSPYAKKLLSQMLQEDLGIEPEDQVWN